MTDEALKTGASETRVRPYVKICGLTDPETAAACAALGPDAIGLVFFPKSPRHLDPDKAARIREAIPESVAVVGVFVNAPVEDMLATARRVGLDMIQLHGSEPPETAARLKEEGLGVLKVLYVNKTPSVDVAPSYAASVAGFLVETAGGVLPGGNALTWDWASVADFGRRHPLILAGGLSPDTVAAAIAAARPDAVDVSSGVESAPGLKDVAKVAAFLRAVRDIPAPPPGTRLPRSVFRTMCRSVVGGISLDT